MSFVKTLDQSTKGFFMFALLAEMFGGVMIHYLKNKVVVVDFANAQGVVMF